MKRIKQMNNADGDADANADTDADCTAMKTALERVLAAKEARRKLAAKLPIHEKIKIVIRMQEMAAPILKARGKRAGGWKKDSRKDTKEKKFTADEAD